MSQTYLNVFLLTTLISESGDKKGGTLARTCNFAFTLVD